MHAPIRYYGGKGTMFNSILPFFPEKESYNIYVEPFAGSFAIGLRKPITEVEIYNDLDKNVYSLYKVLSDEELYNEFKKKCDLAYYVNDLRLENKEYLKSIENSDEYNIVDRAFAFFHVNRTSHNGVGGFSINTSIRRNMSKSVSDLLSAIDRLPELHERLSNLIVTNQDAIKLMEKYKDENVMIYADPPYHHSTRGTARYDTDMSDEQHIEFLNSCLNSNAKILISGYDNPLYEDMLVGNGWNKHLFSVKTVSNKFTPKTKIETLWYNY